MADPRKIRIRYEIDVTLDQSEYGPEGQSAEEALELVRRYIAQRGISFIHEWCLDQEADFSVGIVE